MSKHRKENEFIEGFKFGFSNPGIVIRSEVKNIVDKVKNVKK